MKTINLNIPTNYKELISFFKRIYKYCKNLIRQTHNAKILIKLEKEICGGYWDNDISLTMRKSLTSGFPNGKINRLINQACKDLK